MVRFFEGWLVSYMLNALWQVPLVYVAARVGAWMLRGQPVLLRHRLWVGASLLEVVLPAAPVSGWVLLRVLWRALAFGRAGAVGSVHVVQGSGGALGGVAVSVGLLHFAVLAYGVVLLFFAGRLMWNLRRLSEMGRVARRVMLDGRTRQIWDAALRQFGLTGVALMESPLAGSPLTMGVLRRRVMLPPGLLTTLPKAELLALFAHECAHVKRYDFGWNLLYEVLVLPIAFHPCLWWTRDRFVESREWVCDALAAHAGAGAERYAHSLLRLATQLLAAGPVKTPHAIGMLDANAIERRVMQLTKPNRSPGVFARATALAGCAVLALGTAVSASAFHMPVLASGLGQQGTPPAGVRISGGVMAGNILSRVNPVYPPDAKAAHIQGSVVLGAVIGKDGSVENLQVISGPEELRAASIEAVRQWVYKPFLLNGEPTAVQTTITVNFQLND